MKKYLFILLIFGFQFLIFNLKAQDSTSSIPNNDPLIPQLFAFDKEHQVFAAVNNVSNAIDIIYYKNDTLRINSSYEVDKFIGRHDLTKIYRPQTVAIYDGKIVFLANQIDSCYICVLNLDGTVLDKQYFQGDATSFSYNPHVQELYIAANRFNGYDIIVLDTKNGIINMQQIGNQVHYERPRKAEAMTEHDPYGIGLTVIAMAVVFLALLVLYLLFKNLSKVINMKKKEGKNNNGYKELVKETSVGEVNRSPISEKNDLFAAIAAAIFLYTSNLHDQESEVITIRHRPTFWGK
jgi:Na+-transporting methylmalonyl-CoA/oxaloacetate decarboxylase gamma subunit